MKIRSLKLVYFSPTGTTKSVVQNIAHGIQQETIEQIDITKAEARRRFLQVSEDELLIVAVPVYMGRVPAIISSWLHSIKAQNTPTACVVVYGNRAYENALLELKDILTKCGCKIIAGAAFIGEHSFSSEELPCSAGRPDFSDLLYARLFGRKIKETLQSVSAIDKNRDIIIPGNYPYGGTTDLWHIDFIAVNPECTRCGICVERCPVDAIDSKNSNSTDKEKCILCCACIKGCPQKARTMKSGLMKDAAIRCHENFKERKGPEYFL